jgi:hypothetical protein
VSENLKGRDRLEDLGVDGKIILEWIWGGEIWWKTMDLFIWFTVGTSDRVL